MQKPPHATFKGQVRRGNDTWKRGRVQFYVEAETGSWTVQLYHEVNPDRIVHRYKSLLGKSANIAFKCSRLIIGDKKDGELHIKIPESDTVYAQKLVRKIMSYNVSTPTHNRAEVGLAGSRNGFSGSKERAASVTPKGLSTLPRSEGWLSKKTPPPSLHQEGHHQSSAKRKIQLETVVDTRNSNGAVSGGSARKPRLSNGDLYELATEEDEEDDEVTFPHFTGMKDYSKSQRNSIANSVGLAKGLGPANFYGAQNSMMAENAYRKFPLRWWTDEEEEDDSEPRGLGRKPTNSSTKSLLTSPLQQNGVRSPKVKRAKLCDLDDADRENKVVVSGTSKALLKGALSNRMTGQVPMLSDPQGDGASGGLEADELGATQDTSGHISDSHMIGFDNLGNTCFMNSPLQCLSSLEPLSLDIQSAVSQFGSQLSSNSITRMLYLLMKDVRKLDVRPERVREILTRLRHDINGKFEYNTQQAWDLWRLASEKGLLSVQANLDRSSSLSLTLPPVEQDKDQFVECWTENRADAHELLAELLDRTDEEVKALLSKTREKGETCCAKAMPSTSSPNSPSTSAKGESVPPKTDSTVAGNSASADCLRSTPTEANFTWFYKTSFFFHECKTEVVSSQDERDTTLMLALDSKTMNLQDCIDKYFESSDVDMRCEKCGKEEKATMTRKIVKRPRCFILNLLRYHTHNLEAKKKLDRVSIPRFMSVVEFCAEDVKAAPAIDPVFMLDREKILPDFDLDIGKSDCPVKLSMSWTNRASQLDTFEDKLDKKYPVPNLPPLSMGPREKIHSDLDLDTGLSDRPVKSSMSWTNRVSQLDTLEDKPDHRYRVPNLPPRSPPAELSASLTGLWQPPNPGLYGNIGETLLKAKARQFRARQMGRPVSSLTPPSDDDGCGDVSVHNNQVVPSGAPQSCSSPKFDRSRRVEISIPVTPITNDGLPAVEENHFGTNSDVISRDTSKTGDMLSPLAVDVNPARPLRRRNPAGDVPGTVDPHRYVSELDKFYEPFYFGHEVEVPYETSPGLPTESAAVEAARRGKAVAMAMAGAQEEKKDGSKADEEKADEALNFAPSREAEDGDVGVEKGETDTSERAVVKRLANHLADQFSEVEQHIDIARQAHEDFTEIYSRAQNIISNTNNVVRVLLEQERDQDGDCSKDAEEQLTMCLALMRQALSREKISDDELFYKVMKKLVGLRYRSVCGHVAQMNHLVNDLSMYLAAKEVGVVVDPDAPTQHRLTGSDTRNGAGNSLVLLDHMFESESESTDTDKVKVRSGNPRMEECTSRGEVFMEEGSSRRGSLEVNPSSAGNSGGSSAGETESESFSAGGGWVKCKSSSGSANGHGTSRARRKSSGEVDADRGENCVRENGAVQAEEESSGALADVSNNATINTTKYNSSVCDPGFLGENLEDRSGFPEDPLLLGRPVSSWSEQDLGKVDIDALNEEDMMIYAQALSRIEYEREQISHRISTPGPAELVDPYVFDDFVDDCGESAEDGSAVGNNSKHREGSPGATHDAAQAPGEVSSTSGSSLSELSNDEAETQTASPGNSPSIAATHAKTKCEAQNSRKVPELVCEESLSDMDEPDAMNNTQPVNKAKGLKGGQSRCHSQQTSPASNSSSGSERQCQACGQTVGGRERKLCSQCRDGAKVLSPSKSQGNLTNVETLPPLAKSFSSSGSSSGSKERDGRNPHQSSSHSLRRPPVSPASSSASGGHQKAGPVNARDMHMLSPTASQLSPRKDTYSLSQTKSARNELARLRSPSSASPRKRPCKDSTSAAGKSALASASKRRLSFEDENSSNSGGAGNCVKSLLASGEGYANGKNSHSTNLLDNYSMQEDLINGSLATSAEGEEADPDGIHQLLSPGKKDRTVGVIPSLYISPSKSKLKSEEDPILGTVSGSSGVPLPVPIAGSLQNATNNMKMDSPHSTLHSASSKPQLARMLLSSSPTEEAKGRGAKDFASDLSSCDVKENLRKECGASGQTSDLVSPSTKSRAIRAEECLNDEKENLVESSARRERLENIEMGKADSSYRLVGIVNHHGESLFAGHYTAFSFNFNKQRWFLMDDKHTRGTSETTARAESAHSGYVFFYMDKDIFDKYAQSVSERASKQASASS